MAAVDLYVPVYMVGANGKRAYQFAKVKGVVVTSAKVPEGELCIRSNAMTLTPAARLQPDSGPEPEPTEPEGGIS